MVSLHVYCSPRLPNYTYGWYIRWQNRLMFELRHLGSSTTLNRVNHLPMALSLRANRAYLWSELTRETSDKKQNKKSHAKTTDHQKEIGYFFNGTYWLHIPILLSSESNNIWPSCNHSCTIKWTVWGHEFCVVMVGGLWWPQKHLQKVKNFPGRACP